MEHAEGKKWQARSSNMMYQVIPSKILRRGCLIPLLPTLTLRFPTAYSAPFPPPTAYLLQSITIQQIAPALSKPSRRMPSSHTYRLYSSNAAESAQAVHPFLGHPRVCQLLPFCQSEGEGASEKEVVLRGIFLKVVDGVSWQRYR
jgi:hypothetical protein